MSNHQHTLIIDGTSGISGDMTVAALLDLGASEEHLREQLATLPVDGFSIAVTRVNKHGIDACDFDVQLAEGLENHDHDMAWLYGNEAAAEHAHEHEHHHHDHDEHEHEHTHEHEAHGHGHEGHHHAHHHHHRSLADVTAIIDGSQLSDGAKRRALAIFTALAAAEAKAHGKTPDTVMFHEVGAVDSIVDVCSVAICLDDLGIEDIVVESLSEGHGTIRCAHGLMPIPVPAVVNLCQAGNIALTPAPVAGELVTPTGAAIVAALRTSEHLPARYRIEAVGYGAGKRPYEGCSGTLRCLLVDADALTMDARKAKSRTAIVAAFSELLREEDYGKITVGDIIARAHVGRATFYGLFKSKDDLLAELVSDICTHALDDDGTPLDDPLVQVEHILNNLWERRQGVRALVAGAGSRVFADCLRKTIMSRAAETVPTDPNGPRRHHGPKLPTTPHSLKLRRTGPMVGLAQLPSPKKRT